KSRSVLADRIWSCSPRLAAAACRSREKPSARAGLVGSTSTAKIVALGSNSCNSSSRFGPNSAFKLVTPVRLPPGRFRLATSPTLARVAPTPKDDGILPIPPLAPTCRSIAAGRHNHGHLTVNQFGRKHRQSIILAFRPAIFDLDVLAFDISCLFQSLAERTQADRVSGQVRRCAAEEPDHWHRGLLRARRERPRNRRAAECSQQFPPSDGDCHTPLPCEVRKGTIPRHERPANSAGTWGGRSPGSGAQPALR